MTDRSAKAIVGGYGARSVLALGLRRNLRKDLYHFLLTTSWLRLFLLVMVGYVGSNALFALGYLALGNGIENARPGSFADAFFFSVQTMATIGYGRMAPVSLSANLLVAAEALIGLLSLALITGLIFAKFSRPTARVLFSRVAVVTPYDGIPSLMFRMANERANQIVEAQLNVMIVRNETTVEGDRVRRVHDLALRRDHSALFALTWTAIHPITRESPLHGQDAAALAADETEVVVSLTGFDETLSQTIHARHAYATSEVVWNVRFRDIMSKMPNGLFAIDYRKFHDVLALELEPER